MKPSTQAKSNLISGIILIIIAAFFSITLLMQLFDYGTYTKGFFLSLGDMLFSAYGFCSILIPAFFLTAGLSCFATKWTARKAFRLLTAIVPFFTCVICEKIITSLVNMRFGQFTGVKIIVVLITGIMLVSIEFLAAGIIADKINHTPSKSRTISTGTKLATLIKDKVSQKSLKSSNSDMEEYGDIVVEEVAELPEEVTESVEETESYETQEEKPFSLNYEEAAKDISVVQNSPSEVIEEALPVSEIPVSEVPEQPVQPAEEEVTQPLLSQEEYAALIEPEPASEEIEWNNVPPAPETLPPEYDSDYFEDEKPEEIDDSNVEPFEYDEPTPEGYDFPDEATFDQVNTANNDDPYAAANYIQQKIVTPQEKKTSQWPTTIDLSENEKDQAEASESSLNPATKSKYGSKIDLSQDFVDEPINKSVDDEIQTREMEALADQMEDDAFDLGFDNEPEEEAPVNVQPKHTYVPPIRTPDFVSPYSNTPSTPAVTTEPISYEETENQPANKNSGTIFSMAADVFSDMDKDIREENGFDDFPEETEEEKIDYLAEEDEPEESSSDGNEEIIMYEGSPVSLSNDRSSSKELNPNAQGGARNLTPDELTDFFNAQEKANTPVHKTIVKEEAPKNSSRARKKGPYIIPSDMLTAYEDDQYWIIDDATKEASIDLKNTLAEFNIEAEITGIKKGPVVTMFEILPAPGVKLSKIVSLQDNIALRLAASSVRIVAPIPGKRAVGIEVPNRHRSIVGFREIIEQDLPEYKKMAIPVVLGKDILGKAQLLDLVKTPHLLIAGATGAGKSVCVNSIILSILFKRSPDEVKLIMVDPKVVELKLYNDIPHLLTPVITEPKKALQALQYCLCEMERRYSLLDHMGVRDISSYNKRIKEQKIATEKLPYIIVIIDEFADLMATTGKETENVVARLTAMSRAVGIHLVLATQRPSVNVITGLIKANIPSRIAFMVASRTDSGIIIDSPGAEKLLGRGDMLYASAVDPNPVRIQGTFISDEEVESVVDQVKAYGEPDYIDEEIFTEDEDQGELFDKDTDFGEDPLYEEALQVVIQAGKASASYIQRRLKIGYNRAARLVEEMEERGIIGPQNGSKPREILYMP